MLLQPEEGKVGEATVGAEVAVAGEAVGAAEAASQVEVGAMRVAAMVRTNHPRRGSLLVTATTVGSQGTAAQTAMERKNRLSKR